MPGSNPGLMRKDRLDANAGIRDPRVRSPRCAPAPCAGPAPGMRHSQGLPLGQGQRQGLAHPGLDAQGERVVQRQDLLPRETPYRRARRSDRRCVRPAASGSRRTTRALRASQRAAAPPAWSASRARALACAASRSASAISCARAVPRRVAGLARLRETRLHAAHALLRLTGPRLELILLELHQQLPGLDVVAGAHLIESMRASRRAATIVVSRASTDAGTPRGGRASRHDQASSAPPAGAKIARPGLDAVVEHAGHGCDQQQQHCQREHGRAAAVRACSWL
jgi:hypothetical protein